MKSSEASIPRSRADGKSDSSAPNAGTGLQREELRAVLEGKAEHRPRQKSSPQEPLFQLLVDISAKKSKGAGYERWAKKFNLKEMSKTLIFLQEQKIADVDELNGKTEQAVQRFHDLQGTIQAAEKRMAEIAALRTQINQLC